jgi:hypothetical protein
MRTMKLAALPALASIALIGCAPGMDIGVTPPVERIGTDPVVVATTNAVPAGVELVVSLDQPLSTGTNNVGDYFYATLQTPVHGPNNEVLIARGARISGTVTGLRTSIDATTPAVIRLDFDRLYVGERSSNLSAEIVNTQARTQGGGVDAAVRGAVQGAAAGAVLGAVIGRDVTSAVRGAALGAGVGTVISLGTADREATLEQGSHMTLRLTQPLAVPR